MTCGALYTGYFVAQWCFEDKILVPKPPQNCATCGNLVDGLYCRPCAFVRKCLNEGWYTIRMLRNEILNTSKSSNENTNVKETDSSRIYPYWNSSMIDDEEARDNFLKDVCTFLRKFSRIPFGITPKVILIAWERFGEIKDALMDKQYRQKDIQD
ncbi:hypothetical protein Tco_0520932 [Tanacetum coccineum]